MGFYVLQVYVPCIMLVILSWVSFFLNRESTSDRSCIGKLKKHSHFHGVKSLFRIFFFFLGIMCVLSLATLSFDVRNDIPSVPYTTALDWFLIMCYLFLFASLLEFTLVHYFTKVNELKKISRKVQNLRINFNILGWIRRLLWNAF